MTPEIIGQLEATEPFIVRITKTPQREGNQFGYMTKTHTRGYFATEAEARAEAEKYRLRAIELLQYA